MSDKMPDEITAWFNEDGTFEVSPCKAPDMFKIRERCSYYTRATPRAGDVREALDHIEQLLLGEGSYSSKEATDSLNVLKAALTAQSVNGQMLEALKEGAIAKAAYLGDDYDPSKCNIQKQIAAANRIAKIGGV